MRTKVSNLCMGMFLILLGVNANAQGFQLGVKGFANLSSIRGFDDQATYNADLTSKATLGGGIFATIKAGKIGVQPEVQLLNQGTRFDDGSGSEYNQKMTYLKIPVMVNFYIIKQLHLEAGPYFGVLIDAERKLASGPINPAITVGSSTDEFKTTDVGIAAGVGADIKRLNLSLRYMLGLTDINDLNPTVNNEKYKNGIFQFGIGISIINKD